MEARNKLLACIFLDGTDERQFSQVISELSNQQLTGQGDNLETVEDMMTMLSHRSDGKPMEEHNTHGGGKESQNQNRHTGYYQCHKCGKKGHRTVPVTATARKRPIRTTLLHHKTLVGQANRK